MTSPIELKPERIWKLFEVDGFQILVQLGYKDDGDEDKHYVTISSPMNDVMVAIALGFPKEELAQKAFEGVEGAAALETLKKYALPMIVGQGDNDD